MFYKRRKTVQKDLEAVSRGEDLWTPVVPSAVRQKIIFAIHDLLGTDLMGPHSQYPLLPKAHRSVIFDLEVPYLGFSHSDPEQDFLESILSSSQDVVYSQIEALIDIVRHYKGPYSNQGGLADFERTINTSLRESWVSCELVVGKFVDFDSRELHTEVVVPALTLLGADPRFEPSERAYRAALKEIHEGSPEDAITDASTAVQEMLATLGVKRNSVSKAVRAAVSSGLLAPYDVNLGSWIEADRSGEGDAHNSRPSTVEDAWLIVHVVGALILRLSKGTMRGPSV